ncbi:MAG: hypothetical protein ACLS35_10120, partial [Odoribacter splanchnicus]
EPYKRKAKLIRFGLSRGFDYEVIDRCLQHLLTDLNDKLTIENS